ncbi:recombinase family protein [Glutamicibacter ectropisis]|uniref:recombinase family protein n=1 Tax=Glutamicibacter ectropisis TaxID=3046593 RepID=UPI0031EEC7E1
MKLSISGSVHDPIVPEGELLLNVLALVAEFEADLIRARMREGMAVAEGKNTLYDKQLKLSSKKRIYRSCIAPGTTQRQNLPNYSRWPDRLCVAPIGELANPLSKEAKFFRAGQFIGLMLNFQLCAVYLGNFHAHSRLPKPRISLTRVPQTSETGSCPVLDHLVKTTISGNDRPNRGNGLTNSIDHRELKP